MTVPPGAVGSFVRTVRGDIAPHEVGFTHCHEHTFIRPGPSSRVHSELLLDSLDKTCTELNDFHAAGGRTVVDAQPIGPERAPRWQRIASERTGVHIVAATGFHRAIYYDPGHFRFHETAEQLAARMVAEINRGMTQYDAAGAAEATDIKAGVLKFASDYHLIDAQAEKVAEAVAMAHLASGAPILTHTEFGTCGLDQIALFRRLGVRPSALLLSHLDRNPDHALHEEIADAGAYLVYDGVSRIKYHPDSTIVQLICRLAEAGHVSRILLGMDMGAWSMWRSYGGGPGMTYLGNVFLRSLRIAGMGNEQIGMFTEYNPASALSFRNCEGG